MIKGHSNIIRPQRLLRDGMIAAAERHPNKTAIVVEGKAYSYAELLESSSRLATALTQRGIARGDRVAIYMSNTWPCMVSIYAVLLAAGAFMPINPQTKAQKLAFMLDDSEAKMLITECQLANHFLPAMQNLQSLSNVIVAGDYGSDALPADPATENFDQVLQSSDPLETPVAAIPNDLAALIYTSGSTGFPKGVMQSHQSMVFAAWSLIEYQRLSKEDRILLVLPIAFDYGLYQLLMAMKLGATLIVERSFVFPALIYRRIEEQKVTVFPAVPMIYALMIASHKSKMLRFPTITRVTNTAAALSPDFIPYLHEIFPNALIYKMYGLTECKRVCYLEPELVDDKPGSVGRAIPGTEVYLLSPQGEPVAAGETGILYVRGPHLMMGYWKRPEQTDAMLKPGKLPGERVLCTGDLFRMDDDGLLYFVSRSDDIIKTRGEKVSPLEVENVLLGIEGIKEAAVIGVEDSVHGQLIKAFVSQINGAALNDRQIRRACSEKLENFMLPSEIVLLDELPKTENGKLDKKTLVLSNTDRTSKACPSTTSDERHLMSLDSDIYRSYSTMISSSYPDFLTRMGIDNIAEQAEGVYITDSSNKRYIDCTGGYGIFNLGHNHPQIIESVVAVLTSKKLLNRSFLNALHVEFVESLQNIVPPELDCTWLCNSGSEAVDSALKLAKLTTRKKRIIAANGSFHGYTCGALSVTGIAKFRRMFEPLLPGVTFVEFGDIEELRSVIDDDVAAVILEPMQHEAGIDIPPLDYFSEVSALCEQHSALFILDEVKTGFGKTGSFFACDAFDFSPDILVLGKSIGGGVIPSAAMLAKKKYWKRFSLSFPMSASSNAGNALACAAGKKTIEILTETDIISNTRTMGNDLEQEFGKLKLKYPNTIKSVKGRGLLWGIEVATAKQAHEVLRKCVHRGVFAMPSYGASHVIMIEPPLTITRNQLASVVEIIDQSIRETDPLENRGEQF